DFDIYEEIQLALIENDFDNFNGSFSSTKLSEGKEKALINAIEIAKERAQLIAKTSGVTLGEVTGISHGDYEVVAFKAETAGLMRSDAAPSMMDFSQTVSVNANIQIEFAIEN